MQMLLPREFCIIFQIYIKELFLIIVTFLIISLIISLIIELSAETADPLVTATHAIYIGRSHKAPAAVVGLQFQHSSLATHFVNITSTVN